MDGELALLRRRDHFCFGSGEAARPPSNPMKAPAVRVNTCSQAAKSRSVAFGIGSDNVEIQTITAKVTVQRQALIPRSSLNIGLMARMLEPAALGMLTPSFVVNLACFQVDDRRRKRVRNGGPGDGEHGPKETRRRVVEDWGSHG